MKEREGRSKIRGLGRTSEMMMLITMKQVNLWENGRG